MALNLIASGTQTMTATPFTAVSANATAGLWLAKFNLSNMAAGNQIQISISKIEESGDTTKIWTSPVFQGVQANPNVFFDFTSYYGCTITISQLDTAYIAVGYNIQTVAGSWTSIASGSYTLTTTLTSLLGSNSTQEGTIYISLDSSNLALGDTLTINVIDAVNSGDTPISVLNTTVGASGDPDLDFTFPSFGYGWNVQLAGSAAVSVPYSLWYQAY